MLRFFCCTWIVTKVYFDSFPISTFQLLYRTDADGASAPLHMTILATIIKKSELCNLS